jgi:hypothetical protein
VATSVKTIGHWRIFQPHSKAAPSPMPEASRSAIVGPAMTRVIDTRMKMAMPTVSPSAVSRVFHHGRLSVMS